MNATDRQLLGEFELGRSYWPEQLQLHRGGRSCHELGIDGFEICGARFSMLISVAQYQLGRMYEDSQGVTQDHSEALWWWSRNKPAFVERTYPFLDLTKRPPIQAKAAIL